MLMNNNLNNPEKNNKSNQTSDVNTHKITASNNNIFLKRTLIILTMVILLVSLIGVTVYTYLGRFQYRSSNTQLTQEQIDEYEQNMKATDEALISGLEEIDLGTPVITEIPVTPAPDKDLRYIMLIGIDSHDSKNWESANTDVMKLLVIDEDNKEIKLISFMRDILTDIDGMTDIDGSIKMGKLNSVYYYTGPDGLCRTISKNFQIPVDEYVIINWNGVEDLVNAMGGVEIDIKPSEIGCMNEAIRYQRIFKYLEYTNEIYKSGPQILDGNQALAYCRVRHCGNGDFDRVNRQVVLMEALLDSIRTASLDQVFSLLNVLQEVVKTNISPTDMIKYAEMGYGLLDSEIQSMQIPAGEDGGIFTAGKYSGWYVLQLDYPANTQVLHEFIGDLDEIEINTSTPTPEE